MIKPLDFISMNDTKKKLKYLNHGIYLQIFIGIGYLGMSQVDNHPQFMTSAEGIGGLLIMLALNSLIYTNRGKRNLQSGG